MHRSNVEDTDLAGYAVGLQDRSDRWAIDQCPALEAFDVPCFANVTVGDTDSSLIQERCPRLRHLFVRRPYLGYRGGGAMGVMVKLPEQRLETFYFKGYIDEYLLQLELALSRHTETLREIWFVLCRKMNSSTIKTILTTHLGAICLTVKDAIKSEWVCQGLENLQIAIDMGQQHEEYHQDHHASLMKSTLDVQMDEDELVYWEGLETLDRMLGSLTHLT
ncbi:hypothetical protein BGX29_012345 [Mortierella sp. GBA35]|nr:hypothetical protein BGX29_012345 [Mortierella sp. GBA35]